jgi:hypothetical protein
VEIPQWLPAEKQAAICFTIDDIHPGKSSDAYEAGGDLEKGALGHVQWLLERHPQLRATLFVTADWRELAPHVTRPLLAQIPILRDSIYLAKVRPLGEMRLSRHPEFVAYLKSLPRTDVSLHGLHHIRKGKQIPMEFLGKDRAECDAMLSEMISNFREASLPFSPGMCPPAWAYNDDLGSAMLAQGLQFVAPTRDIRTPIAAGAVTAMSGVQGVSLIHPEWLYPESLQGGQLLHFSSNFQATSPIERAFEIIENNGLVAIKAHIIKNTYGHIMLDGMDDLYRNYLDLVFTELDRRYGNRLWWTSMAEITACVNERSTSELPVCA